MFFSRKPSTFQVRHQQTRKFSFDQLEERQLMAADLFVEAAPKHQPITIACFLGSAQNGGTTQAASQSTTTEQYQKFSAPSATKAGNSVGSSQQPEAMVGKSGRTADEVANGAPGVALPTVETINRAETPRTAPAAAGTTVKQPLTGLKTPTLDSLDSDEALYSGEIYLMNLQNTKVSTNGDWGTAAYEGKTNVIGASGSVTLQDDPSKGNLSAKVEGDAYLLKTTHKGSYQSPTVMVGGQEIVTNKFTAGAEGFIGVKGSAETGVAWNGTDAGLKAKAEVFAGIEAKGDVGMENRVMGVKSDAKAGGYARAGAEASGEAQLTVKEGLALQGNAFAGAKAGGELKSSIAGIGVGVEGEAWAGAGADAELSAKMDNGKFKFKTSLGASPIVGGKTGFSIEVDPSEVAKAADVPGKVDAVMTELNNNEDLQSFGDSVESTFDDTVAAADSFFSGFGF